MTAPRLAAHLSLVVLLALVGGCRRKPGPGDAGVDVVTDAWRQGLPRVDVGPPHDGGTLVVRAPNEPGGLNPLSDAFRVAWGVRITHKLVLEPLVELGGDPLELAPGLATSWQLSDGNRRLTLQLRPGVTFHDGSSFGPEDVVATLDVVLRGDRPTKSLRGELAGLETWRALDGGAVELTWSAPTPLGLRKLAQLPILSAEDVRGDWAPLAEHPNGTGPFKPVEWRRGDRLTLGRSGTWWGGTPPLDRVVFRFVKDHAVAATAFEKGEFDLMTSVLPAHWRALEAPQHAWAHAGYQRLRGQDNAFSFIAWNGAAGPLADVRVRRALWLLYPAATIERLVDLGLETPTTCPFYVRSPSCDPALAHPPPALAEAKALLADAGFVDADGDGTLERDGQPLDLPVLVPAQTVRLVKVLALYQELAQQAGVRLRAEPVETATLTPRIDARDFVAVSRLWSTSDTETDLRFAFHSSQRDGGLNFVGFADPDVDRLLDALDGEFDAARRSALERDLHRRLVEQQPYLILSARQSLDMAKNRVHGLVPSVGWYDLRRVWVSD